MTEEQRILKILTQLQACDDVDELWRLHQQLPEKLSHAIMIYGLAAATDSIRDDPALLNHVGPMGRAH